MQCPCGGTANLAKRELKTRKTIAAWCGEEEDCLDESVETATLSEWKCTSCGRLCAEIADQDGYILALRGLRMAIDGAQDVA